jgi:hypothetical protein
MSETKSQGDVGVEGNSRLTSVNGMLLLALLAVEGVTVLDVRQMITLHVYLGILLVGPVLLKCASTVYRFARYYAGVEPYVGKGPPHPLLRTLGPFVIVSSLAVLGTGIGLVFAGPMHREPLLTLHQGSFIVWLAATSIHVLGHLFEASRQTWDELSDTQSPVARRRGKRTIAITLSLVIGVGAATAMLPSASDWTSHRFDDFGRDEGR